MNQHELAVVAAALEYCRAAGVWDALIDNGGEDEDSPKLRAAHEELFKCKRALFTACDEYERVPD